MVFYFQIYSHGVTGGSGAGAEWCRALLLPPSPPLLPPNFFFYALRYCIWVILRLCVHAGKYVLFSSEHMERSTQTFTFK